MEARREEGKEGGNDRREGMTGGTEARREGITGKEEEEEEEEVITKTKRWKRGLKNI